MPRPDPKIRERRIALLSFVATCCSVFLVYLLGWQAHPVGSARALLDAAAFTTALMGILLVHEAAHYLVARAHGFGSSLPWFLPAPVLVGTFGAIIRLEGRPPNRQALVEMGAAGPLAGFAATLLVLGTHLVRGPVDGGDEGLGLPLLWRLGALLMGVEPAPVSTADPLGFAAWLGCLLTAMNLLPFGQLDGGHVLSGLAPGWRRPANATVTGALLVGALLWPGWLAWCLVIWGLGLWRAVEVEDASGEPGLRAHLVAAGAALILALCLVPAPT